MKNKMTLSSQLKIRAVALDLDGVVYEGDHVIKGAAETIYSLKEKGIDVYFVTNNSGKKRASIADKLNLMGIESTVDQIITSGYCAAVLVNDLCRIKQYRICLIGSEELAEEFFQFNQDIVFEPPAEILVVGLDKAFNYARLSAGLNALRRGAIFVACNRDRTFPVGDNQVLPGCGPVVAALEWAWGKQADHIVGKPNTMMLELIAVKHGLKPCEILVVGDSLESDIAMAKKFGCPSVLISHNDLHGSMENSALPDFCIHSIERLITIINEGS